MNEIDRVITLMRKDSADVPEIITGLIGIYIWMKKVRVNMYKIFHEHRILNGELIDNIGFPILITLKAKNQLNIVTSNINNVHYIQILQDYYDAIMKLYQNSDELESIIDSIEELTKKKINEKIIENTKAVSVVHSIPKDTEIDTDFFTMNGSEEVGAIVTEDDEGDVFGMMDDDEEDEGDVFGMMDEGIEDEETSGGSGDNLQGM